MNASHSESEKQGYDVANKLWISGVKEKPLRYTSKWIKPQLKKSVKLLILRKQNQTRAEVHCDNINILFLEINILK